MKIQTSLFATCLSLIALAGCTASPEDCDKLGDHFVTVAAKEAEAQGVPGEMAKSIAEGPKKELVEKCKTDKPLKSEVDCLLAADSVAGFEACK